MKIISNSEEETKDVASKLAQKYQNGGVIALFGNLGAGKTTFTAGFAQALGIKNRLISPTFILMREYPLPNKEAKLYHLDLYRIESPEQIEDLGLKEIFENPKNIVLIEWAEKLANLPQNNLVKINFEYLSPYKRQIIINE